ncbi:MAG: glycine C-acetyltransferase [Chlamydiales bacterium]
MDSTFLDQIQDQLSQLKKEGLYKEEKVLMSPQQREVNLFEKGKALNFCSNNYLGLANHPYLIETAQNSLKDFGFGLASVRFICGTQTIHLQLEKTLTQFLKTEDTILYSSCFDANGGLFETLLGAEDVVISDSLNHASIIDGIRLCKAKRLRYQNSDMKDLEEKLKEGQASRFRLIATDGVFSMDGTIANLSTICDLADKYRALVMVDDCHATGFLGKEGRGTHEHCDVIGRVDILTGTFGKALGGASGGYTSGRKEIISWLRQRSRPYLFSNTLCPAITAASLAVFDLLQKEGEALRNQLWRNADYFRQKMSALGFELTSKNHPIIPVMLKDEKLTQEFAKKMQEEGILVIGFSYPVVPLGLARIRTQMSADHTLEDLDRAIGAFEKVGKELGII